MLEQCGAVTSPEVASPEVTGNGVTGSAEPEMTWVIFPPTFKFHAKIQISQLRFELIATIQIDQWERFPPKKIYLLILRTDENCSYNKTEPMKTFDSSNQSEKNPALVIFKFKIHHFFNNSRSEQDVLMTIPCIIGYLSSTF